MFVSKDGSVTGSIDVSKLDQVEPKTDEARAQIDGLKADLKFGQEQVARDEERVAELHRVQAGLLGRDDIVRNINDLGAGDDRRQTTDEQGKSQADQDKDAERQRREAEKQQADEAKQAEAKQAEAAATRKRS